MSDVRLALVVAVGTVATAAADVDALAAVLGSPDLGDFEVDVLHNPASSTITEHLERLLTDRRPADQVLLHFAGPGFRDAGGELYLGGADTRPELLESTGLRVTWINRLLQRSRAHRIIVLLDFADGLPGDGADLGDRFRPLRAGAHRGRVVLAGPTAAVVEGIRSGAADRDRDGLVTPGELFDHVGERAPRALLGRWEYGRQDDTWVARNPHLWERHRTLTPELVERARHEVPGARLGAVNELAPIVFEPDLERAASACAVLRVLSVDSNIQVRMTAAGTLEQAAARPSRDVLDLGMIVLADAPVAGELPVRGSPLALASTVTATGPIKAWLDGPVLRVLWMGDSTGVFEETVTLTNPAGVAVVRVVGEAGTIAAATAGHRGTAAVASASVPVAASPDPAVPGSSPGRRLLTVLIVVALLAVAGFVWLGPG
jgi:hypothetical protein